MKYIRADIDTPMSELEESKVRLTVDNLAENIWVGYDNENDHMYLKNHSVAFSPFPSWGLQLPKAGTKLDISDVMGDSPNDAVITVHPEAYDALEEWLSDSGKIDIDQYNYDVEHRAHVEKSS